MKPLPWIGALLVTSMASGCMTEVNHHHVASTASIHSAEVAGAANNERAAVYLQLAREEVAEARKYGADSDRGSRALERANADAEVALSITTATNLRSEADAQQAKVSELEGQP